MYARVIRVIAIIFVLVLVPASSLGQKAQKPQKQRHEAPQLTPKELEERAKNAVRPRPAKAFHIGRIENDPNRFSLLLSDENSRIVNALFTMNQLLLVEAVILEAQRFADTEEAVGATKAVITRFYDKAAPELVIDVAKKGQESRFFITLQGFNGKLTIEAGKIKRDRKGEERDGVFYSMIKQIEVIKSGDQTQ